MDIDLMQEAEGSSSHASGIIPWNKDCRLILAGRFSRRKHTEFQFRNQIQPIPFQHFTHVAKYFIQVAHAKNSNPSSLHQPLAGIAKTFPAVN